MGLISWLFGSNKKDLIAESKITDAIDKGNDTEVMISSDYNTSNPYVSFSRNTAKEAKLCENKQIIQYREYSQMAEVEDAVEDIINEAVVPDAKGNPVKTNIDDIVTDLNDVSENYKEKIPERFDRLLSICNFDDKGYDYFKNFYVDGRSYIYYEEKKGEGIDDIRFLDPVKLIKVKEDKDRLDKYHYLYETGNIDPKTGKKEIIKINKNNIIRVTSGLVDKEGKTISYLHKALRPINNLKMMENSLVVYRFSRAPERLIFRINVTGMSDKVAAPYIQQMITDHKSRTAIDSVTGEVASQSTLMAMQENYWFAERNGNSHSIESLPGGQNLGEIDDVLYFNKKMYKALNVPVSRLESDAQFSWGRTEEISRDEQKFFRFIKRLRRKFEKIFQELLKIDLISAGITKEEDWKKYIRNSVDYIWENDSIYEEAAKLSRNLSRVEAAREYKDMVEDGYYSKLWVRKNILQQTDKEIKDEDKQIKKEMEDENNNFDSEEDED